MTACNPTSGAKASARNRRGMKIKTDIPISMAKTASVEPFKNQSGSWCAYQAIGVGIGCVSK